MTHHPRALLFVLALGGCADLGSGGRDPTLDELNAVYSIPDPRVDEDLAPDAPFAPGQARDVGDADGVYRSAVPNEFVNGVAMPGDLDGDGYADLLLFAQRFAPPDVVDCDHGCPGFAQLVLHVAYGGPSFAASGTVTPDASIVGWYINGLEPWVAPAGDVDGDGRPDVLISVSGDCQQGNVFLWYGGARLSGTHDVRDLGDGVIRERASCTGFGHAIGVGDLDADGHADFVIAAPGSGRAYLFYGRASRLEGRLDEAAADAVLLGGDGGIGPAQPAGDVDGDGADDLLVSHDPGRELEAAAGGWRLLLGGARLSGEVAIDGESTRIEAAMARGLGDLDGDGRADVGVTRHDLGLDGYVIGGRATWPGAMGIDDGSLRIERAPHPSAAVGATSLRAAGDMNGDGAPDFLYADSEAAEDDSPRGALYLFLGPTALDAPTLDLEQAVAFLGQMWRSSYDDVPRGYDTLGDWSWHLGDGLAAGTDLDGDGLSDLAVVARIAPDYGRVYVWRGRR